MSIDTRDVELRDAIELVEGLTAALRTRSAVACAKGILMERFGLDPDAAIDLLHDVARTTSRRPATAAEAIIAGEHVEPLEPLRTPRPRTAS